MMRQKFWSWGDDYRIRDASENEVYLVNGKVFSWGDKLSFQDPSGHERAFMWAGRLGRLRLLGHHSTQGGGGCGL